MSADYGEGVVFEQHVAKLKASGVSPEVARERGYRSADSKAQLGLYGFSPAQRLPPALVIPMHNVVGQNGGYLLRPDSPRMTRDGRLAKYEMRKGQAMQLDVPRRVQPMLGDPAIPLIITEGPIKADSAASVGLCCVALLGVWSWRGTNEDGGKVALPDWESIAFNSRTVYIAFDSDVMLNPQVHEAMSRLGGFLGHRGARVAYIYLPSGEYGAKIGLDDYLAAGHTANELFTYATTKLRRPPDAEPTEKVNFDDVPDEVGYRILDDIRGWLTDHVVYSSPHHSVAITLWAAHTHALKRAASTPRLVLESPEPESGKTRTLELLECLCRHGKLVLQMSPASVYRWVEAYLPSILLDEIDAVFGPKAAKEHEDLRSLVNAGHRPGAVIPRVETPSMNVVEFSCYCPVALAGLYGALPNTIQSRAIRISMRRRAPDEQVRPFRERITRPEGEALHNRLVAWVQRHGDTIPEDPELPDGVTDRQADVWEPLIAIAKAMGGDWPGLAQKACLAFVAAARGNTDDQSLGIRLLGDARNVFAGRDRLDTATITTGLCDIEDAPYAGWLEGKGDRARGSWLAKKLKPYGIKPGKHRFPDGSRQGYLAADFAEASRRYLPPLSKDGPRAPEDDTQPLEDDERVPEDDTQPPEDDEQPEAGTTSGADGRWERYEF